MAQRRQVFFVDLRADGGREVSLKKLLDNVAPASKTAFSDGAELDDEKASDPSDQEDDDDEHEDDDLGERELESQGHGGKKFDLLTMLQAKYCGGSLLFQKDSDGEEEEGTQGIEKMQKTKKRRRRFDEEWYEDDDGFIDDSELVEASEHRDECEARETVHDGFFVSTGNLATVAAPNPAPVPKKRVVLPTWTPSSDTLDAIQAFRLLVQEEAPQSSLGPGGNKSFPRSLDSALLALDWKIRKRDASADSGSDYDTFEEGYLEAISKVLTPLSKAKVRANLRRVNEADALIKAEAKEATSLVALSACAAQHSKAWGVTWRAWEAAEAAAQPASISEGAAATSAETSKQLSKPPEFPFDEQFLSALGAAALSNEEKVSRVNSHRKAAKACGLSLATDGVPTEEMSVKAEKEAFVGKVIAMLPPAGSIPRKTVAARILQAKKDSVKNRSKPKSASSAASRGSQNSITASNTTPPAGNSSSTMVDSSNVPAVPVQQSLLSNQKDQSNLVSGCVFPALAWPLAMNQLQVGKRLVVPTFDAP
jgi:hypothetical protein